MENRVPDGKRLRAFFKVFIPHMSKDRLKIPSAFTSYVKKKLPQRALIRNRDGNMWPVKVVRIEDDFFFLDGWAKYIHDNSVELGDFVVFQFDGHGIFDVKLLGHSGCEKKRVRFLEVKNEEESNEVEEGEWEEEEEEINEVKREGGGAGEQEEESYSAGTEMDMDSDYMEEKEDDSIEEEEEEEEVEEEQPAKTDKTLGIVDAKSSRRGLKSIKGGKREAEAVKDERKGKRPVDPYGCDLFKSAHIPQPKNPYFVTKIRAKRKDELYVPVDVIEDHNLSLPPEIILRDKQGREWTSKLKTWKDGRRWYYGGWGRLCRVNIVGYDDTCICEFKRRDGGGLHIQVQIVRQGDNALISE